MIGIFGTLSTLLETSIWLALLAAFLWGLLSVLLSPCHLAGIPLIVGYINKQGTGSQNRSFLLSLLFAGGILITIGLIGLVTGVSGRILGDIGGAANYIVAAVLFLFGLHLMDLLPLPFLDFTRHPRLKSEGFIAAFLMGLVFGLALGPCTFAFMAPVLGIVFRIASERTPYAAALLLAYALGHTLVIVGAGTLTEVVRRLLLWQEKSQGVIWIRRVCGVLVVLGGINLLVQS